MLAPAIPINEKERIKELRSFDILDTLPEADYDNITSLAADICKTNIALVSLVDVNRQWFKSHHGVSATETPRPLSFCAHAINDVEEIFVVEDARKDDRFSDNPLVTNEPHVIFYAGVPLVSANGLPLGTLCVIDKEPKKLNARQLNSLRSLGKQVINILELRKKNSLLEDALAELKENNKRMEQFTFIASHDLQEPLRTIKNFIRFIEKDYFDQFDEKGKRSIEYIKEASDSMSQLIKGVLDFSLLGTHGELALVNTNEIISSILKDIDLIVTENNASIQYRKLPQLYAHQMEIRLLFQNLITNAIKFRKQGVNPEIDISAVQKDGNWVFAIKDNGIGIEREFQERVFGIFQRLHLQNEYSGSGIGLAHCKKIVELHKGKIWLESEIDEGCTFYFTIPCMQK